jgi:hypothetical protein
MPGENVLTDLGTKVTEVTGQEPFYLLGVFVALLSFFVIFLIIGYASKWMTWNGFSWPSWLPGSSAPATPPATTPPTPAPASPQA